MPGGDSTPPPAPADQGGRCFSRAAVWSFVLGLLFALPFGVIALPLGVVGRWRTRGSRRKGGVLATGGIFLGLYSLASLFVCCPVAVSIVPPAVWPEDRALQEFFDDVAGERYQEAYDNPKVAIAQFADLKDFSRWADAFNEECGRGRILWCQARVLVLQGHVNYYWVKFERAGTRTVGLAAPDPVGAQRDAGITSPNTRWGVLLFELERSTDRFLSADRPYGPDESTTQPAGGLHGPGAGGPGRPQGPAPGTPDPPGRTPRHPPGPS